MNRLNVPQLRFQEFDGEWKHKKLGEVSNFLDGRRKPIKSDDRSKMKGEYPYYGASGIIDYVNNYIFDEELILLGEDGENIISRNSPLAFRVSGKCWINNHAHVIVPKKDTDIDFLALNLERINYVVYNTGTAQPKLNQEVCRGIPSWFPTLPEQQKIASFLSAVDEKIQQLIRKKELLEQYKKGVMQQLFSGKLRFKDENGNDYADWESVKMNELFSFKQGIQCGIEDQFLEKSDNMERFIRIIDLTSDKEIPRFIKNTDKGNLIFEDDLFMVRYGVPGLIGYGYNGVIANNLFKLIPKKSVHNKFYLYVLTHLKKDIMNLSSSTTMPALNFSSLGVLKIPEIEIEEQQKIATFLSSIDVKIENTHQEINQMQSFKKGLLQQMFV